MSRGLVFLGCGEAAALHARTLSRVDPDLQLHFASRSGERAREWCARHRGAGAFEGYAAALEDPRIDTVAVVTPPSTHLEWTLAALEAGRNVIVEKPAFVTDQAFVRVEAAARRAGRRVLVAENYVYKPLADDLRGLFDGGGLGRILFLRVNALKRQSTDGWRSDPARPGSGALLEGGIHWVSLLASLGPRVERVRAAFPGHEVGNAPDRSAQLLLELEGGTVASLAFSWDVPSLLKGLRLSHAHGTRGRAVFESNGLFFAAGHRPWRWRAHLRDVRGYRAMFRDFLATLRGGGPPRYTLADARRDVDLVARAHRSAGRAPPGAELRDRTPPKKEGSVPWNG